MFQTTNAQIRHAFVIGMASHLKRRSDVCTNRTEAQLRGFALRDPLDDFSGAVDLNTVIDLSVNAPFRGVDQLQYSLVSQQPTTKISAAFGL